MVDIIDRFMTQFAAGAGTLLEWQIESSGEIRCLTNSNYHGEVVALCPLTAEYAIEYGPIWRAGAYHAAGIALGLSAGAIRMITHAADWCFIQDPALENIRRRMLRIIGHAAPR